MRFLFRNRVLLFVDLLGWSVLPLLALGVRLDGWEGADPYMRRIAIFTGWAILVQFASLWFGGLYRRMWRYASLDELFGITLSLTIAGVISGLLHFTISPVLFPRGPDDLSLPRSIPLINALLAIMWSGGVRFALRYVAYTTQRNKGRGRGGERALIIGAGDAGSALVRELLANPGLDLEPVGFIDDDKGKHGQSIFGLSVLGGRRKLVEAARAHHARTAIIALPAEAGHVVREIRDLCVAAELRVLIVPGFEAILTGKVSATQLRTVQIEDLLRREPVKTDQAQVAHLLSGMTVMVTGAGGSIGSEICRQVARFGVRKLVLLGHGENSIFGIENELRTRHPELDLTAVIADIRDTKRLDATFDRFRPEAVFHAAAHKHVPLMEGNPEEAVTNNIGGTFNVLQAAERWGTKHFVLISTDKAVNPTNIMGATKRVAEKLVHEAAVRTGRDFVSVRFGNVLGSRGSVVPSFQAQIAAGGPLRVTHPEMTRYFMTIPEAVQLVLQAAALGKGGETFVLDMGQPVKILDLARDLIQLSGFAVGRDIRIEFTGLRPGEKMFE
ncbi:MAG TPA: nucleoside-diphosphate sugar epimerase/dehydratase, partial [Gemmatimonadales bacterium]|nr:nucleoside-diphosphate sugar epimerase/dehydratase [Gemmatimonadales bacterium]